MDDDKNLDLLFFELASEDRLNILRELSKISLKMQDIARKLDLTATEASRQLQRMGKANLIKRLSDGTYTVTCFGKLLLVLSFPIEFVFKNKDYFHNRDVLQLPISFVYRLGELSQGVLFTELNEVMLRWEELIRTAEDHFWIMTPQFMPYLSDTAGERLLEGVKIRCINNEQLSETSRKCMKTGKNVERKSLPEVPVYILVTEKKAAVTLPFTEEKMDAATFFGRDTLFLKWVNDLFLYYWDIAKKW